MTKGDRDFHGLRWLDELGQDVRFGARTLLKNRGFAFAAILTLGLGIGANTASFSLINGVLLKPLPYGNGERLILIEHPQGQIQQNRRAFPALTVFGVLAPGRTIEEARAEIDTIAIGFRISFPDVYRSNSGFSAITRPVLGALTANARPSGRDQPKYGSLLG